MNLEFIFMLMFLLTAIDFVKLERRNVALNKTVTVSSVFNTNENWLRKESIVDGGLVRDGEACRCCFATQHTTDPWITIDLGQEFAVDLVTVYGRTDDEPNYQSLQGLQLHVVKAPDIQDDGVYTVTDEGYVNFANISLKEAEKARYITLVLPGEKYLVLCEVEVYKAECLPGKYGNVCSQTCGECSDGEICNNHNGECQSCRPGFQGLKCQQACDPDTYGQDCIMTCGSCDANQPCDPITGACEKCAAGYKGTNCLSGCEVGRYGSYCLGVCGQCYGGGPCSPIDGRCDRCAPGYRGGLCDQECQAGTYGENCSAVCGPCKNYDACHHITGFCINGCTTGRHGDLCKQEKLEENTDAVPLSIFIAVVAILVCVIVIFAATLLCILRKWNSRSPSIESTVAKGTTSAAREMTAIPNRTDEHPYDDLHGEVNPLPDDRGV